MSEITQENRNTSILKNCMEETVFPPEFLEIKKDYEKKILTFKDLFAAKMKDIIQHHAKHIPEEVMYAMLNSIDDCRNHFQFDQGVKGNLQSLITLKEVKENKITERKLIKEIEVRYKQDPSFIERIAYIFNS